MNVSKIRGDPVAGRGVSRRSLAKPDEAGGPSVPGRVVAGVGAPGYSGRSEETFS